jgi:hypothetical protein
MSLVFKIMKPASTFHGVDYNEKKQEKGLADKVYFENFGYLQDRDVVTKAEFKKYLEDYSARNGRVQKMQFHAILSCKGNEFTDEHLKDYSIELMRRLGYGDNPLLIYQHHDTKNSHVHIITTRIGQDGKKINHDLEGKRASKILNELLKIDTKQAFKAELDNAFSFNISTISQFTLLMEQKGYKQKEERGNILFYRNGSEQGRVEVAKVQEQIAKCHYDNKRMAQIKALIYKYKEKYNPNVLHDINPNIYTSVKPTFHSDLTNHLSKTFGLQFIFFAAKDKTPYGYAIIDHEAKTVYKGSDIIKLAELQEAAQEVSKREQQTEIASRSPSSNNTPLPEINARQEDSKIVNLDIFSGFSEIINQGLQDVEADAAKEGHKHRKKKRQQR